MRFGYTILYVDDVEATVKFYELAFGLQRAMVAETGEYGELVTGDTKLAFAATKFVKTLITVPFEAAAAEKPAPPVEIGLVSDDVAGDYAHAVSAGATPVKEPAEKPWGQIVGYVRDLNGFLVEICSQM